MDTNLSDKMLDQLSHQMGDAQARGATDANRTLVHQLQTFRDNLDQTRDQHLAEAEKFLAQNDYTHAAEELDAYEFKRGFIREANDLITRAMKRIEELGQTL